MDRASDVTGFPVPDISTSTQALNDVLETEEGKHLADNLKQRMEELSERYKTMTPEERARFEKKFAEKFQLSMDNLKRVVHEKVESTARTQFYSQTAIQLFGVILLIGVIGFIAYRLIKYVQKKEEPKMDRKEKKKALKAEKKIQKKSPVGSPKTNHSAKSASPPTTPNSGKKKAN